jgi:hypothetical protein
MRGGHKNSLLMIPSVGEIRPPRDLPIFASGDLVCSRRRARAVRGFLSVRSDWICSHSGVGVASFLVVFNLPIIIVVIPTIPTTDDSETLILIIVHHDCSAIFLGQESLYEQAEKLLREVSLRKICAVVDAEVCEQSAQGVVIPRRFKSLCNCFRTRVSADEFAVTPNLVDHQICRGRVYQNVGEGVQIYELLETCVMRVDVE